MNKKIMEAMGFAEEMERVSKGNCPFCNKDIWEKDFRNALSLKEYRISGLCQTCQDEMFGKD